MPHVVQLQDLMKQNTIHKAAMPMTSIAPAATRGGMERGSCMGYAAAKACAMAADSSEGYPV